MPDDLQNTAARPAAMRVASAAPVRYLNVLLACMLLTLHGAIAWGVDEWWSRSLLLAHFGLFLIWQPVWRGERRVPVKLALLVLGLGAFFAAYGNWWLIATWIAVLFGLIGGGVPATIGRGDRMVTIFGAVYLVTMLLMWVVPQLFSNYTVAPVAAGLVQYGLPLLPLAILLIPKGERRQDTPVVVDLIYSVVLFLLVVALALGSFVIQEVSHGQYLLGLAQTLMVIGLLLVGLSWLWDPQAGVTGIRTLLSRYLLGLGLPFEQRMRRLAELAQAETRPEQFLSSALFDLLDLPWVTGFAWTSSLSVGEVGKLSKHAQHFETENAQLIMYSIRPCSPAVLLHMNLLMQMVGHFYEAHRREQLRQQSLYSQAIYETGARLTHDVKNLLQSLRSICAAAEMRGADDTAFRSLVQRQLPLITKRLGATLDKLKSPEIISGKDVAASVWWQALQIRHAGRAVVFETPGELADMRLPADLFDSVADTLIENALYKSVQGGMQGGTVGVSVTLSAGPRLRVCDDGAPVPAALTAQLLRAPVASASGLGVGLLQAATFAEQSGYALTLANNSHGSVCFELVPRT